MRQGTKSLRAVLLTVFAVLALPASGTAAPPAHDDFADREVLSGSLPIDITGSNREATEEPDEPAPGSLGIHATGHSVWYEWEATSSGFVTVSTCGSTFRTLLGVYTGAELGSLTEVAGDFGSEGPDCPGFDGMAVTFKAVSGVDYKILVDGLLRFFGEGEPGQGSLALRVDATPLPVNDDFADATALTETTEGVSPGVYAAGASGFNWNATKEPGEPAHLGDQGGASIWYSWTAPSSGSYGMAACGREIETVLVVYVGASLNALTPVASDASGCNFLRFDAVAGTTYRIALDGRFDAGTGAAQMSATWINVFREPPQPPIEAGPAAPVGDLRPDTVIQKKILRPRQRRATFVFGSSESGSGFRCRLDRRAFTECGSPKTYRNLSPGRHVFRVVAVGPTGNFDLSPATSRFRIPRPRPNPAR